jgi:hypothetical protein
MIGRGAIHGANSRRLAGRGCGPVGRGAESLLGVQRRLGDRYVQRLLAGGELDASTQGRISAARRAAARWTAARAAGWDRCSARTVATSGGMPTPALRS